MSFPERKYGLGDSTQYVKGVPRVAQTVGSASCPNCGCEQIFEIQVDIHNHPTLRGGEGVGQYVGCPACPWASPMIMISNAKKESKSEHNHT